MNCVGLIMTLAIKLILFYFYCSIIDSFLNNNNLVFKNNNIFFNKNNLVLNNNLFARKSQLAVV